MFIWYKKVKINTNFTQLMNNKKFQYQNMILKVIHKFQINLEKEFLNKLNFANMIKYQIIL